MSPTHHESAFVDSLLASGRALGGRADYGQARGRVTGQIDVSTASGRGVEE